MKVLSANLNRPPDAVDFLWQWNDARKLKKEELKARLITQEQARQTLRILVHMGFRSLPTKTLETKPLGCYLNLYAAK